MQEQEIIMSIDLLKAQNKVLEEKIKNLELEIGIMKKDESPISSISGLMGLLPMLLDKINFGPGPVNKESHNIGEDLKNAIFSDPQLKKIAEEIAKAMRAENHS